MGFGDVGGDEREGDGDGTAHTVQRADRGAL